MNASMDLCTSRMDECAWTAWTIYKAGVQSFYPEHCIEMEGSHSNLNVV